MDDIQVGDKIEHKLMPGFMMTVLEVRPCEQDSAHDDHNQYRIVDPEHYDDWLCAHNVSKV